MKKASVRKLVVGYLRCSSIGQVQDGETLERQRGMITAYAKAHDLGEVEFISDEGLSGYKSARPGYQRLLEMCRRREVQTIVIYDLSRISRRLRDTLAFIDDIVEKHGISLVSLRDRIETETPAGKAFLAISAVLNQLQRDQAAYQTKAAIHYKQVKGEYTGGHAPFEYSYHLIDKILEPAPDREGVVAHMVRMREQGLGYRAIANDLNLRGVPTATGKYLWRPKGVRQILMRVARIQAGSI